MSDVPSTSASSSAAAAEPEIDVETVEEAVHTEGDANAADAKKNALNPQYQHNLKRREKRKGAVTNPRWQQILTRNIQQYAEDEKKTGKEWTSEELVELYKLVCKYGCYHEVVSHVFSERLAPRTLDEIRSKIVEIHELIEKTTEEHRRAEWQRCAAEGAPIEPRVEDSKVTTWLQAIWELLASRQVGDESNMALADVMKQCGDAQTRKRKNVRPPITNSSSAKCRKLAAAPDYDFIYKTVGMMAAMRDPSKLKIRGIDAAVILSIFDEVEREVLKHHGRQMPLFASIFRDLQSGHFEDFSIIHQLNSNIDPGSAHINLFGFNEEQRNMFPESSDSFSVDQSGERTE
ncbi:hypothetical protein L596_005194 [Steinernema carpocapsae]|uniref:Uncharacterized protein n=1 Tax=Steinernema carpocapsae TaxID=34508 RepID=A0A4U8UZP5_STECR|nr:hypothetical protein L596_005194 [Steinernema carpocapsae]